MPGSRQMTVMIDGRPLESADFGAKSAGLRSELHVEGLGLPPPTEMIRLPVLEDVRSVDSVIADARAARSELAHRAKLAAKIVAEGASRAIDELARAEKRARQNAVLDFSALRVAPQLIVDPSEQMTIIADATMVIAHPRALRLRAWILSTWQRLYRLAVRSR